MLEAPAEPIDRPRGHEIELALRGGLDQVIETGRLSLPLAPEMWSAKVATISQPLRSALQDYAQWVHPIAAMPRGGLLASTAVKAAPVNC